MKESEEIYRAHGGYNNSRLSAFRTSLKEYREYNDKAKREENKNKDHFRKGKYVDCKILTPGEFRKDFIIVPEFKESSQEYQLLKAYVDAHNPKSKAEWDIDTIHAFSLKCKIKDSKGQVKAGAWSNIKDEDKRKAKIDTDVNKEMFSFLRTWEDSKTPISWAEKHQLDLAVSALRTDPDTKYWFEPESEDWEILTQLDILWWIDLNYPIADPLNKFTDPEVYRKNDNGEVIAVRMKQLMDMVKINHSSKVIHPGDLKTTGKPAGEEFKSSYENYGYIGQQSIYSEGLALWRDLNLPDYTIEPFTFVVKSLTEIEEPPLAFRLDKDECNAGKYGGKIGYRSYEGWLSALHRLIKFEATDQAYLTPEQHKEKSEKGYITLKLFTEVNPIPDKEVLETGIGVFDEGDIGNFL